VEYDGDVLKLRPIKIVELPIIDFQIFQCKWKAEQALTATKFAQKTFP